VFLAGQSRGAWQILGALSRDIDVDGAFLAAPAAHGRPVSWSGKENRRFPRAADDWEKLIADVGAHRLFLTFFDGDEYDPGGRVEALQRLLGDRIGSDVFVLDRPENHAGHGAAAHTAFFAAYGDCLTDFLDGETVAFETCRRPLDPDNERHAATEPALAERGGEPVASAELEGFFSGRAIYPARGNRGWWGMLARPDGSLLQWFAGSYLTGNTLEARWEIDDGRFCVVDSLRLDRNRYCYAVYRMPSGKIGLLTPDGMALVVATEPARTAGDLAFRPGDWKGSEGS
jgi:hypothetical protein